MTQSNYFKGILSLGVAAAAFAGAWPAVAQVASQVTEADPVPVAEEDKDDPADGSEIIVTGTQIRGIAPVGANVVALGKTDIESIAAADTNQVLAALPQSESFLTLPQASVAAATRVPIRRPNLRNLPQGEFGSGSPTLVLMDGHSIVPLGFEQSVVDAGVVPSGILERVETILDGASSIYGSDAVGGVLNFITRRRFDKTQIDADFTIGKNYHAWAANVTTGAKWDTGSVGFTYSFGKNTPLLIGDRDYALQRNYVADGRFTNLACEGRSHTTITGAGAGTYRTVTGQPTFVGANVYPSGTGDWCPSNEFTTLAQGQERHSGFMVFQQELSDKLRFDMTAFYFHRITRNINGPFTATSTIAPGNFYYRPIAANPTASQSVTYSLGPVFGTDAARADVTAEVAQITPSLRLELGRWQVRALMAYGQSTSQTRLENLDSVRLGAAVASASQATAVNPYDPAATLNRAAFDGLVWTSSTTGKHELIQGKVVADGPLFAIGGGDISAAVGVEWNRINFKRQRTDLTTRLLQPFEGASATSKAIFAEIVAPIFSEQNAVPGIHKLTLSASGRYDSYATYGDTFNPKIALSYSPIEWVTFRGNWGTSFRAPNAVDKLGSSSSNLSCSAANAPQCSSIGFSFPTNIGTLPPAPTQNIILFLNGSRDNLVPETSKNWSLGIDLNPPFLEGLKVSATYYSIDFKNRIGLGAVSPLTTTYRDYAQSVQIINGLPPAERTAAINAFTASATNRDSFLNFVNASNYNIVLLLDGRSLNISRTKAAGLDLSVNYLRRTGFGSIYANVNANWMLKEETQITPTTGFVDGLRQGISTFRIATQVGAEIGNLRASATWRHRGGFSVDPAATRVASQTFIGAFDVLDLAFRWSFKGSDFLTEDLDLTLNISNVFDAHPPINMTTTGGPTNGSTLGRLFQIGFAKSF